MEWLHPKHRRDLLSIAAATVLAALISVLTVDLLTSYFPRAIADERLSPGLNSNPSSHIAGVVHVEYPAGEHIAAPRRVAYDQSPPFGGPHDGVWATCSGNVYSQPIRNESVVHSLEHGAVWLTFNPDEITEGQVAALAELVDGQPYTLMSPYPGLDRPISVQSWGRQLKLDDPGDQRLRQFIALFRLDRNGYVDPGASCASWQFDPANPPPFDPTAPGPDSAPVNGLTSLSPDEPPSAG